METNLGIKAAIKNAKKNYNYKYKANCMWQPNGIPIIGMIAIPRFSNHIYSSWAKCHATPLHEQTNQANNSEYMVKGTIQATIGMT